MILVSKWVWVLLPTNSFWVLHSKLLLNSVHPWMLSFFSTLWNLSAVSLLFLSLCFIPHSLKIVCSFFIALPPLYVILQIVCSFWFSQPVLSGSWLWKEPSILVISISLFFDGTFDLVLRSILRIFKTFRFDYFNLELVLAKTMLRSISTTHN